MHALFHCCRFCLNARGKNILHINIHHYGKILFRRDAVMISSSNAAQPCHVRTSSVLVGKEFFARVDFVDEEHVFMAWTRYQLLEHASV
jgi:hypothetical protein